MNVNWLAAPVFHGDEVAFRIGRRAWWRIQSGLVGDAGADGFGHGVVDGEDGVFGDVGAGLGDLAGVVEDGGGGDGTGGELAGFLELAEFFPTLDLCPLPFASKSNFLSVVQGAVARFRASVPDVLSDSKSN